MKQALIWLIVLGFASKLCFGVAFEDINITGDTNYSSSTDQSLKTNLYIEYNISLYEPSHKKWGLFLGGKVNPSYDHLGNETRVDVFTVLGIDF